MVKLKLLVEGWANFNSEIWEDYASVVYIENNNHRIIFDPGSSREKLLSALKENQINVNDITHVVLSHRHLDHTLLMGIFPKAKIVTEKYLHDGTKIYEYHKNIFGKAVEIVNLSGHTKSDLCLLVTTTEGKYALSGDLFWWNFDEVQEKDIDGLAGHQDRFALKRKISESLLEDSRRKILSLADFVIPGHGKIFSVPKI
jgi:glyoxylase-like metal-dependent hydrolase (beta-lactamase superfamily II)